MGKEICYFIIHFLIFYVLTMIEDIVERFYGSPVKVCGLGIDLH